MARRIISTIDTHARNWRGFQANARTVIKGLDGYMSYSVGPGPMGPKGQGMIGYEIKEYDSRRHRRRCIPTPRTRS